MPCKQGGGDGRIEPHQTPYFILCADEVRRKLSLPCGRADYTNHTVKSPGKMPERNKKKLLMILISIKNVFYPFALSNAHDGITRKVVDCLAETVYHLFQCSKYLIAKSSGS